MKYLLKDLFDLILAYKYTVSAVVLAFVLGAVLF